MSTNTKNTNVNIPENKTLLDYVDSLSGDLKWKILNEMENVKKKEYTIINQAEFLTFNKQFENTLKIKIKKDTELSNDQNELNMIIEIPFLYCDIFIHYNIQNQTCESIIIQFQTEIHDISITKYNNKWETSIVRNVVVKRTGNFRRKPIMILESQLNSSKKIRFFLASLKEGKLRVALENAVDKYITENPSLLTLKQHFNAFLDEINKNYVPNLEQLHSDITEGWIPRGPEYTSKNHKTGLPESGGPSGGAALTEYIDPINKKMPRKIITLPGNNKKKMVRYKNELVPLSVARADYKQNH